MERVRNKNQHYDAWLHWNLSSQCNFDCDYCFGKTTPNVSTINSIDIENLLKTLGKTGKIFRISFTGGEPFLIPNIISACETIAKVHYVSFNTNLVLDRVKEFAERINPARVLNIHASLHYDELMSKNLFGKYYDNYHLLKENAFNIYTEAVAYPLDIEKITHLKTKMNSLGIPFTYAPYYGSYNNKFYPLPYSDGEISAFNLNKNHIAAYSQKGAICNAGFNAAVVSPRGNVLTCFSVNERLGNIYNDFAFKETPTICPAKKCGCPLNFYDSYLYRKLDDKTVFTQS